MTTPTMEKSVFIIDDYLWELIDDIWASNPGSDPRVQALDMYVDTVDSDNAEITFTFPKETDETQGRYLCSEIHYIPPRKTCDGPDIVDPDELRQFYKDTVMSFGVSEDDLAGHHQLADIIFLNDDV